MNIEKSEKIVHLISPSYRHTGPPELHNTKNLSVSPISVEFAAILRLALSPVFVMFLYSEFHKIGPINISNYMVSNAITD